MSAIPDSLIDECLRIAREVLPLPARTDRRYGIATLIVHEAAAFNTIVVDWWEQTNELRHHVFRAPSDETGPFVEITSSGESVCVWELRIQAFEREAWLRNVLLLSSPDFDEYLGETLSTGVEP